MTSKTVYGFDRVGGLPIMAIHTFSTTRDGQLQHEIDGYLRATVPPEGWADYVRDWPDAADIVAAMTKPAAPAKTLEEQLQEAAQNAVNAALQNANPDSGHVVP